MLLLARVVSHCLLPAQYAFLPSQSLYTQKPVSLGPAEGLYEYDGGE